MASFVLIFFCTLLTCQSIRHVNGYEGRCPDRIKFAIGTFTESPTSATIAGKGIVFLRYKNKSFRVIRILSKNIIDDNPTYIAKSPQGLYVCNSISPDGKIKFINHFYSNSTVSILSTTMQDQRPTHVSVIRRGFREMVLVANVNGGTVKTFQRFMHGFEEGGSFTVPPELASKLRNPFLSNRFKLPHPHMVLPYIGGAIVPDLGSDYVFYLSVDMDGRLSEKQRIEFMAGDGPRHAIAHSSGKIYVVNEQSVTIATLILERSGLLKISSRWNLLDGNPVEDTTAAAIRLTENEKHLYVSVRPDTREVKREGIIVGFEVDLNGQIVRKIGEWRSHGVHPRDFYLVENMNVDGECRSYVAVANRDSDNVVFIKRDRQTGTLLDPDFTVTVKSPASVLIIHHK